MPIVDGPISDRHRRNAGVIGPDEQAATGSRPECIALVELANVPRDRRARRVLHSLLHAAALAVIDERGVDRRTAERGHGARQAIVDVKRALNP
jgi:hypothetical protein